MSNPVVAPKHKYKKNFLSQVIFQVTFASGAEITDDAMKTYKTSLGGDYSELAIVKQQGIIIQNDGSNVKTNVEDNYIWQIDSATKDHTITVAKDSFAISFVEYSEFKKHLDVISSAQEKFFKQFSSITHVDRLGLRYVNQIKLNEQRVDWTKYLSSSLTDSFNFVDSDKLRRSMHSIVITEDEETQINLNYGIYNQYFPAPIVDEEFIIDIDAYTPASVDVVDCGRILEKFNKTTAIYFELCIKDELRTVMEIIS